MDHTWQRLKRERCSLSHPAKALPCAVIRPGRRLLPAVDWRLPRRICPCSLQPSEKKHKGDQGAKARCLQLPASGQRRWAPGATPYILGGSGGLQIITAPRHPMHLPIAHSLGIFSSQILTSKLPVMWLGRQAAKLPGKSPAAGCPHSSSRRASHPGWISQEEERMWARRGVGGDGGDSSHLGT